VLDLKQVNNNNNNYNTQQHWKALEPKIRRRSCHHNAVVRWPKRSKQPVIAIARE